MKLIHGLDIMEPCDKVSFFLKQRKDDLDLSFARRQCFIQFTPSLVRVEDAHFDPVTTIFERHKHEVGARGEDQKL
jgi:hypothetical protein